jgi:hypothetical protein
MIMQRNVKRFGDRQQCVAGRRTGDSACFIPVDIQMIQRTDERRP